MLQRIQTVFLLVALALLGLLFALPYALMIDAQGVERALSAAEFPALAMQAVTFVVTLVAIFLYKKRMLQIRLCTFSCVALLGFQAFIIWHAYSLPQPADAMQLKVAVLIPALAAILTFLALRGIAKDEALVKSLERLR